MEKSDNIVYYSKETIELLHSIFDNLSPDFWHHVMNPYCGECLAERGRDLIAGRTHWGGDRLPGLNPVAS